MRRKGGKEVSEGADAQAVPCRTVGLLGRGGTREMGRTL